MGNTLSENRSVPKSRPKSKSKSKLKLNLGNKRRLNKKMKRNSSISSAPTTATIATTATTRSTESSHRYIDGRRYNENSKYALPNDDEEIDRLHMQHYLQRYIWQGNYRAPVHNILRRSGARVLDVGCGPGTWMLEMAFDYQNAHFTGIDIDPTIYPQEIKPINVNFEEADLTQGLPFADDTFDFVVMRNMVNVLTVSDWEQALKELERVCKPGGFVECLEFELPANRLGKISKRIADAYVQVMRTKSIDVTIAPHIGEMFTNYTTLTSVEHHVKGVAMGNWGDKVGKIIADDAIFLTKALAPVLIPMWGIGAVHYHEYTNLSQKEYEEGKCFCNIHSVFAQKYEPYRYI